MTETYRVEAHCQEDRGINAANISNSVILEKVILEKFGKDPRADKNGFAYEYTDQDIWEQIRKMLHSR